MGGNKVESNFNSHDISKRSFLLSTRLTPKSSYLIINDWTNATANTSPKLGSYLFSWNNTAEYSQHLSKFEHNNFRVDRSCSTYINGSMMLFGGFYNSKAVGMISECGIKVMKTKMPIEMHSHSCVSYQSTVLLCGTAKNETACLRYAGDKFLYEGRTQVGHSQAAMVVYNHHDITAPAVIIGGKTGDLATGIVEQFYNGRWNQFSVFPVRIYG